MAAVMDLQPRWRKKIPVSCPVEIFQGRTDLVGFNSKLLGLKLKIGPNS